MPRGAREFDPSALRTWRERRGITQEQLASAVGVQRTYAIEWERDRDRPDATSPTPAMLARIAQVLDVHPSELTSIDPDEATLADLRIWAGLTRTQLAQRLGITATLLARTEHGQRDLDPDLIDGLARELSVDPAQVRKAHAVSR